MSKTVYAVQYRDFEYDDQFYSPTDGYENIELYESQEKAEEVALKANYEFFQNEDIIDSIEDVSCYISRKLDRHLADNNIDPYDLQSYFNSASEEVKMLIIKESDLCRATVRKLEINE